MAEAGEGKAGAGAEGAELRAAIFARIGPFMDGFDDPWLGELMTLSAGRVMLNASPTSKLDVIVVTSTGDASGTPQGVVFKPDVSRR